MAVVLPQHKDFVTDEVKTNQSRAFHCCVKVALDGFLDIPAKLFKRITFGVDAIPKRICRVPAVVNKEIERLTERLKKEFSRSFVEWDYEIWID